MEKQLFQCIENHLSFDNEGLFFRMELVGGHPEYFLKEKTLEFMKEYGFDELNKILKKESKISKYEERLLTGIYWFGEAVSVITYDNKDLGDGKRANTIENFEFFYRGEKLLKLFIALESVLIFNNNEQITENIAERAAILIFEDYDSLIKLKKRIKRIYDYRNKTTPQGIIYVFKHDLSWITNCVRNILENILTALKI